MHESPTLFASFLVHPNDVRSGEGKTGLCVSELPELRRDSEFLAFINVQGQERIPPGTKGRILRCSRVDDHMTRTCKGIERAPARLAALYATLP